jgi:hypothetical protein
MEVLSLTSLLETPHIEILEWQVIFYPQNTSTDSRTCLIEPTSLTYSIKKHRDNNIHSQYVTFANIFLTQNLT